MTFRRTALIAVLVAAAALIVWLVLTRARSVETAKILRGRVRSTVEEDGRTKVPERYLVSAPISGRLLRVELEEGDRVKKGQVVARIEDLPVRSSLDAARARIRGIEAALAGVARLRPKPEELERAKVEVDRARQAEQVAESQAKEARAAAEQAHRDAERARHLFAKGTIPSRDREDAELAETRTKAAWEAAEALVKARGLEVKVAELSAKILAESAHDVDWKEDQARADIEAARADIEVLEDNLGRTDVKAPVAGTVLRRMEESQRVVPAGTPILEIGDLSKLEVEADLLSEDAARMKPGMPVEVFGRALGGRVIAGRLKKIDPAAFTKVSSLGVEQQRTTVTVSLPEHVEGLGDRYRVEVRVIEEEKDHALLVPEAALVRTEGKWHVFRVEDGRARLTTVRTGLADGRVREVLSGLETGDRVVMFPPDDLEDGERVK